MTQLFLRFSPWTLLLSLHRSTLILKNHWHQISAKVFLCLYSGEVQKLKKGIKKWRLKKFKVLRRRWGWRPAKWKKGTWSDRSRHPRGTPPVFRSVRLVPAIRKIACGVLIATEPIRRLSRQQKSRVPWRAARLFCCLISAPGQFLYHGRRRQFTYADNLQYV